MALEILENRRKLRADSSG